MGSSWQDQLSVQDKNMIVLRIQPIPYDHPGTVPTGSKELVRLGLIEKDPTTKNFYRRLPMGDDFLKDFDGPWKSCARCHKMRVVGAKTKMCWRCVKNTNVVEPKTNSKLKAKPKLSTDPRAVKFRAWYGKNKKTYLAKRRVIPTTMDIITAELQRFEALIRARVVEEIKASLSR
jgi:hypothetical protein